MMTRSVPLDTEPKPSRVYHSKSSTGAVNSMSRQSAARFGLFVVLAAGLAAFIAIRPGILSPHSDPDDQTSQAVTATPQTPLKGIDVSHYQGDIAWDEVAQDEIMFAYAKATQGLHTVDAQFANNSRNARDNNILLGAYHFFQPDEDPVKQALHFLSQNPAPSGALPPAVDVETASRSSDNLAQSVVTFIQTVTEKTGCAPVIYSSLSFWNAHLKDKVPDALLWLAEYRSGPEPAAGAPDWVFWQHDDKGQINGISGHVDLNLFEGGHEKLAAMACK
jgi:lysozyme